MNPRKQDEKQDPPRKMLLQILHKQDCDFEVKTMSSNFQTLLCSSPS
jgi:hypothetical protein